MLSNLIQYFTKIESEYYEDNYLSKFMRYIQKYTLDDEIQTAVEKSAFYNDYLLFDMYELGMSDTYADLYHWEDFFEYESKNIFLDFIFSTITEKRNYKIMFDIGAISDFMDTEDLSSFTGYKICHKIDKKINRFILSFAQDFVTEDNPNCIDDYYRDMSYICVGRLRFTNKSIGRKIRKAYAKYKDIRIMFNELGFGMSDGEFICLFGYNSEDLSFFDQIDFENIYPGIEILRKVLKNNHSNAAPKSFCTALMKINKECMDSYTSNNQTIENFIRQILTVHRVSESEVIL